jgi:GTP-binding protein
MADGLTSEAEAEAEAPSGPIRVAIVGKPNVGKSSLLNRLLGEERALVSDIPGTTRDPVDSLLSAGDREFLLVDTAGIRRKSKTGHAAELLSVFLARRSLQDCHVALLVLDASGPPTHQDAHIGGLIEEARRAAVMVLNKWDLVGGEARARELEEAVADKFSFMDYLPRVRTSAKTKRHVDHLLPAVERVYRNFTQSFPTASLNKTLKEIVARVSPPSVQGKEFKIRYATQTGTGPPAFTLFTNSKFPPPDAYSRYLKNRLREACDFEGSPLILRFRKE